MIYKLSEFFQLPSVLYNIEFYKTNLSKSEFLTIVEKVRYYSRKFDTSYLCVFSSTNSATAKPVTIRNGQRGRPRKAIQGSKVPEHTHLYLLGNSKQSACSTAKAVQKSLNKRYSKNICKIQSKGTNYHASNCIGYALRQADIVRSGGDFDFIEHQKSHELFC